MTKLGVNIDHIATLRQARKEGVPDLLLMALDVIKAGAEGITVHLREDRRHIQDQDVHDLKKNISVPLNLEMAATSPILAIACEVKPAWVCLVPEKREELTTEGGLNISQNKKWLSECISELQKSGIKVSLFIDPNPDMMLHAKELKAEAVELHTGLYARQFRIVENGISKSLDIELNRLKTSAQKAHDLGLIVNAGHGIDYENVSLLHKSFSFNEFNIGFSIVARALQIGMGQAVKEMKARLN